jgi:hypothetical protein
LGGHPSQSCPIAYIASAAAARDDRQPPFVATMELREPMARPAAPVDVGSSSQEKGNETQMPAFRNPGFQERQEAAARARDAALAKYRERPPVDEALMAERAARRQARLAAEAERRAAALRAREEAAEAKREQERRAVAEAEAAAAAAEAAAAAQAEADANAKASAKARKVEERKLWTEEDRKAARDARYAARKMRQGRR